MKRRELLTFMVVLAATSALAGPDDAPPNVELLRGPYVRAGRPLEVRVIGGADRVAGPGTPWALPQGANGDEFVLQMPSAYVNPISLVVRRGGSTFRMRIPVLEPSTPDSVVDALHEPLSAPPDPQAYSATAEAAAATPLLPADARNLLLLLAATEAALVVFLALRRDGPWTRAAWLAGPALAAAAYLATSAPLGSALRATPVVVEDETGVVVFVRVEALRDGSGVLELPESADDVAVVRFAPDDVSFENLAIGPRIEATLRAGETRVFAYRCQRVKRLFLHPSTGPVAVTAGPRTIAWLGAFGEAPQSTYAGVQSAYRPIGRGIDVLPGLDVVVAPAK